MITTNALFQPVEDIGFHDPRTFTDADLSVALIEHAPSDSKQDWCAAYCFAMIVRGEHAGAISLRISDSDFIRSYAGHIGYRVYPAFRGHHYAARAVRLIAPIARIHGIDPIVITCNPDNTASINVIERIGGIYANTVELPKNTDMYARGERFKRRYLVSLDAPEMTILPCSQNLTTPNSH